MYFIETYTFLYYVSVLLNCEWLMVQRQLRFEAKKSCLECHYLSQPNPDEALYICLRSLESLLHEIEEEIECIGFEEIHGLWIPAYVESLEMYT